LAVCRKGNILIFKKGVICGQGSQDSQIGKEKKRMAGSKAPLPSEIEPNLLREKLDHWSIRLGRIAVGTTRKHLGNPNLGSR